MKKRIAYISLYFFTVLLIFILQKPLFMLYNGSIEKGFGFADYMQVMVHGASLDAATAGYLTAFPFLLVLISIWFRKFPLKKILYGYYILAAALISIIFVVDMALYTFWGFKLDASVFLYIDSPKEALASVSVGFILLRVLAILLLIALNSWVLLKITPSVLNATRKRIAGTAGMLLLGGVLFIIIRGGVTESTSNIGQVYFSNEPFLNHSAVNPDFSLLSSMGKSQDFASEFNFFDEEKRAALFDGLYPTTDGDSIIQVLNTKRPNILIILMEGFGGAFVEPLGGLPDVTPHFNRLSKEGVFFTNCYANSFRTDRGTVCTFSGYLGLPTASVMKIPAKSRTLPAIAEGLSKAGYKTDFLYGGDINFTNMKSYLLSTGYQRLTANTDFSLAEQTSNAWGVNDDITFEYLYNQLRNRKEEGPWHTAFLTLSSHEPFEVPYHRLEDKIPNAFAYTDECLGKFIDRLKQTPAWKDLLVICLPDHGFYYPREGSNAMPRFYHIPLLWLGGAVKQPVQVDKIMNQTDLAATLLGQLGLEHTAFTFSRNVLGSDYKYPFAFYSFNNGFSFRDSTGVTVFDNNSGSILFDEPEADESRLDKGKAILQTVYDDLGNR
ncbi:sulfatase-like hydrolase/transferase [Phocaeicola vulgatus]|jgi:phosphoglycerol transferase MdoB-like AlkP superfamily enzyme|uniref:LTA synthase family protein n=1 Tax=Phocaeicola vulgatus TaxID=821 RepID=UPI001C38A76D|nr:alkaline phosphatase family protein [Phocaeicola vulgatus]MBV4206497.1 sulfatase-like hydrolase/transferase [Phocaeicola vulgatus]MBV4210779.1 sulfatase-like hydrolase/transferase [Phocaeicola vulgatus]MCB6671115.1 sulfatase-like hydrolase/transferase [Phocaeicola vulgatus]MCB6754827.1 sulfatase-like hydrolase/transferase [Phocaeicola vulgatus]MCB6764925.1 sulfatase-like hydrolase/transferase [Phocaeicola vulgatus]